MTYILLPFAILLGFYLAHQSEKRRFRNRMRQLRRNEREREKKCSDELNEKALRMLNSMLEESKNDQS